MYITGIGRTKFGTLNRSIPQLVYEAICSAISDSPVSMEEIDAIYVSNFLGSLYERQLHLNSIIASLLPGMHIPIIRIETACASGGSAIYQGLISLNKFENILVVGVEKMTSTPTIRSIENIAMACDRHIDQKQGLVFPASYALIAKQHMASYGTTMDDLTSISFKNYNNARYNPSSQSHNWNIDKDMIIRSDLVAHPLRIFDCSQITDGAAAIVLSKHKKSDRDIKIIGSSLATDTASLAGRKIYTSFPSVRIAAKQAFAEAGIAPKDIDVAEVHDCFTIAELVAIEDLGFCEPGESKNWVREERTTLHGDLPINTDGGLIADGHPIGATGIAQVCEIVTQLRGEANQRQINDAEVGLTHNVGGTGGTAVIIIMRSV